MRRSAALIPIALLFAALPHALGDPARDPFTMALPSRDTKPPEGRVADPSTRSVIEQQGTAAHSVPIAVPDGRLGMQPSLALTYSSGGALRGGVAVGWTLDTPMIERDPAFPAEVRYRTSLGGGWQRLVSNSQDPGTGERYRAEVDSSFTRYRRDTSYNTWTASGSDGVLRTFTLHEGLRWRLTSEKDPFGNEVVYTYTPAHQGGFTAYVLQSIQYTSNASAGLPAHAKVDLIWDWNTPPTCGGIAVGAATDYHFSYKRASGTRKLLRIETSVKVGTSNTWRLARRYALSYDTAEESCYASALRYLTRVDETAYTEQGVATAAPPITFGYGPKQPVLDTAMTLPSVGFGDQGRKLGPTSTLLDMDGDGLVDRVDMKTGAKCRLEWKKGTAPGQFSSTVNAVELPTARWREGDLPLSDEYCTLSGQKVVRSFSFESQGCTYWTVTVNYHLVDIDADGRIDVLTQLNEPHLGDAGGDFAQWSGIVFQDDNDENGGCPIGHTPIEGGDCAGPACPIGKHRDPWGACVSDECPAGTCEDPDPTSPVCGIDPSYPEQASNGVDYVWRVQRGLPGGAIAAINTNDFWKFHTPRPLTPNGSEATLDGFGRPNLPRLTDIDGDGYLDLIATYRYSVSYGDGYLDAMPGQCQPNGYCAITVWPGQNYASQGAVKTFGAAQTWNQTAYANTGNTLTEANVSGTDVMTSSSAIAFRDMNADGLPDVLVQSSGGYLSVAYNMAGSLYQGAPHAGAFSAPVSYGVVSPAEQNRTEVAWEWRSQYLNSGFRASLKRLVDLDSNGFLEMVTLTPGTSVQYTSTMRKKLRLFGSGSSTVAETNLGSTFEPIEGRVTAIGGTWRRESDFTDLTGDGQPDLVTWGLDGSATLLTDHGAAMPLHLLQTIDNGRGGVTRFEYASSNDTDVVTLDGKPLSPRFVVSSVTTTPGFGQPDMKTSYRYATPVQGRNSPIDPDAPGFLGFTGITIDSSGQVGDDSKRVVKTFDYAAVGSHWRGQLRTEMTSLKEGGVFYPTKHVTYAYGSGALANSTATVTFPTTTIERTCYAYSPDWLCATQPFNYKTTTSTWIPKYLAGVYPSLYLNSEVVTSDGGATAPRYHRLWYLALNGPTDFRVFTTSEERGMVSGASYLQWAFTTTIFDYNSKYLPVETRVYRDLYNYSATKRGFDLSTGVQTSETKPNQVAGTHQGSETYTYDPHKLFIVSRTDEHTRITQETFDIATGAVTSRTGPSYRFLVVPGCGWYCFSTVYDYEAWAIDGFGRVLEHRDSVDPLNGSPGYEVRLIEWFTYDDASQPNRTIASRVRNLATYEAVIDEKQYDGSGRVFKTIARRQIAGECDPETRYTYDAGGELQRVDTPDPRTDDCATVATSYTRDGVGRLTTLARPDGSSDVVTYDGLSTTTLEMAAEGAGQKTQTSLNLHGELALVIEFENPSPGAPGYTTYYNYDPLGRTQSIVDADGNTTTMTYDFRGLRTSVTRGGRTWTYRYDATGNLEKQIEPIPSGGAEADYTSTTSYNAVNQPTLYKPARRGMSDERRAELGIGDISMGWDCGASCVGKPYFHSMPFGQTIFEYDALGNRSKETRTINIAGTSTQQWVQNRSDALGNVISEKWDDGAEWRYQHDHRGAVESVSWLDPALGLFVDLANYERSAAGQPRHRTSSYDQERDWTYDVMGRVVYERVFDSATEATLHERQYGYDGFGDLRMISGFTDEGIYADYTYDRRHRLTHAEGPLGYEATFEYTAAGNIDRADVSGGVDAPGRYVDYSYGITDPQAVDWLTDVYTGSTVASYTYDRAGNMIQRHTPQGSFTFAWGADGSLREVAGPNGTERYFFGPNAERMAAVGPDGIKLWFGSSETHLEPSGYVAHRYHHIGAGGPIARVKDGTQLEFQYTDPLQNLVLTTDPTGNLTSTFAYGAFGEVVSSYDGLEDHRRRFNGKEHDAVSGLRHYGYRSYDPYTLRWVSGDPLYRLRPDAAWTEPQRANLYAFSLNNPMRYVDPDGRNPDAFDDLPSEYQAPFSHNPPAPPVLDYDAQGYYSYENGKLHVLIIGVEKNDKERRPKTLLNTYPKGRIKGKLPPPGPETFKADGEAREAKRPDLTRHPVQCGPVVCGPDSDADKSQPQSPGSSSSDGADTKGGCSLSNLAACVGLPPSDGKPKGTPKNNFSPTEADDLFPMPTTNPDPCAGRWNCIN